MELLVFIVTVAIVTAIVAAQKGRSAIGWFFLGLLFNVLALIVVAVSSSPRMEAARHRELVEASRRKPRDTRGAPTPPSGSSEAARQPCPSCGESIPVAAKVCRFCKTKLPEPKLGAAGPGMFVAVCSKLRAAGGERGLPTSRPGLPGRGNGEAQLAASAMKDQGEAAGNAVARAGGAVQTLRAQGLAVRPFSAPAVDEHGSRGSGRRDGLHAARSDDLPPHASASRGRPSKLQPEIVSRFTAAVRLGNYRLAAARFAGISEATMYRWLDDPRPQFAAFRRDVQIAEAQAEAAVTTNLVRLTRTNTAAALVWLRTRYPERWPSARRLAKHHPRRPD